MVLSASGTFAADSGRSIFLEQHLEQRGIRKYFRWEIPYPYIHRVQAEAEAVLLEGAEAERRHNDVAQKAAAAAAGDAGGAPSILPLPQRPKTA
jgi:hypothetical protein